MGKNNPYQAPSTPTAPADNRRLHKRAKAFLLLSLGSFVLGAALMGSGVFVIFRSFDRTARSDVVLRSEEVANEIARTVRTVWLLNEGGIAAITLAVLVGIPATVICLLTRKPDAERKASYQKQ